MEPNASQGAGSTVTLSEILVQLDSIALDLERRGPDAIDDLEFAASLDSLLAGALSWREPAAQAGGRFWNEDKFADLAERARVSLRTAHEPQLARDAAANWRCLKDATKDTYFVVDYLQGATNTNRSRTNRVQASGKDSDPEP